MGVLADELKQDHEDMRTMVAVLSEMASRFEAGVDVPSDDVRAAIQYMDTFVNRCHHVKEEQLLFPALEEAGLQRDGGPLEIMSAEHQLEINFLAGMQDALGRYAAGDKESGQAVAQYARDFSALLARDMEQEDELILPLAEQQLPKGRQDELATQFAEIETKVLGPSRHERYHEMAHSLAERYLN
jgi:hemerythrin-like domain-containing protein